MKDYQLGRRPLSIGRVRTARAAVRISGRRFLARPLSYTAAVNVFPLLYRLGAPAGTLARICANVR